MRIHKWKNNELNKLLMEKFNLGESWKGNRDEEEEIMEAEYNRDEEEEIMEAEYNRDEEEEAILAEEEEEYEEELQNKQKPDYIDLDNDGNKKESMKKAAADKKSKKGGKDKGKKMDESYRRQVRTFLEQIMKLK